MARKEILKIREECLSCRCRGGDTPETASCTKGNIPTCFRKKKRCKDWEKIKEEEAAGKPKVPEEAPPEVDASAEGSHLETKETAKKIIAYTDGSFNKVTRCWGYGIYMLIGDKVLELTGSGKDEYGGWQVLGEINAALAACKKALELGAEALEIRYDYEGVSKWPLGLWKTNKSYTEQYAWKMQGYMRILDITFRHIQSHTGDKGNETADHLAKKACGLLSPSQASPVPNGAYTPDIPRDLNPKCRDAIHAFYQKKGHKFGDYMKLKTYGMDPYSYKPYGELTMYAAKHGYTGIVSEVYKEGSREFGTAIRWTMRGLTIEDALRKVQVDAEVAANCNRSSTRH